MRMLKFLPIFVIFFGLSAFSYDTYVRGYTKRDGTYVSGYHRTSGDNTVNNNYGTRGNLNPYTGASGTLPRNPYQPFGTYNQGNGLGED